MTAYWFLDLLWHVLLIVVGGIAAGVATLKLCEVIYGRV